MSDKPKPVQLLPSLTLSGNGEFLPYQTEDAQTCTQIRPIDETLWLSQKQIGDLYQVSVPTVIGHLRMFYRDGELQADRTIRKFRIVARGFAQ